MILLRAPIAGWATPLDEVPDPVFAERMAGEGIAIDPTGDLVTAPAAGRIVAAAPTGHSVTLELDNGAQILIHLGIDTVGLAGEGFELLTTPGQRVAEGDPLIRFDLDRVARRAKSLVSPIVVANPGYRVRIEAQDRLVEAGAPLLAVERIAEADAPDAAGPRAEREAKVGAANGIHARPAARIATFARQFAGSIEIGGEGGKADARSMVALLALALKQGDGVRIVAVGPDSNAAADAVARLVEAVEAAAAEPARTPGGHCASPGMAVGPVAHLRRTILSVPVDGLGVEVERRRLDEAIATLSTALAGDADRSGVAAAHLALLDDPLLRAHAAAQIEAGRSAGQAWQTAIAAAADALRATGDTLLIERIADLDDIAQQLLLRLAGGAAPVAPVPQGAILVADELLPSQFLALAPRLAGFCTARGGPTSHVALLAAAAGIPAIVGAGEALLALPEGAIVLLDADKGRVESAPDAARVAEAEQARNAARARREAELAVARDDCFTADGTRIEIFANLASEAEAAAAVAAGAEGCGLLRTEFLFQDRAEPPSEAEQAEACRAIAAALGGRPLIVRTLDIGADKPVAYLPSPPEANPALGRRGIRLSLARPDLLAVQFRAILAGVPRGSCRIMLPMIADLAELRAARALLDQAVAEIGGEAVPLGIMVETPAAALIADTLAAEADFLSVGTNDLAQYTLARDRTGGDSQADPLHPAVLRLVAMAAEAARHHGRWFGICGGLASDPLAAPLLIGLGATELSAAPAAIPAVKAAVRRASLDTCRALARTALACASAEDVRGVLGQGKD